MKIASLILGLLAIVSFCLATRYTFVPAAGIPVIYRCDRWTGHAWISQSGHSDLHLHWKVVAEPGSLAPWEMSLRSR